jgi:tetratricopeptide (TPR) repeat protein
MRFKSNMRLAAAARVASLWWAVVIWCVSPCLAREAGLPQQNAAASKSQTTTRTQKIVNPLNELLDEAQKDIDKSDFAAAIDPLQKVIAAEPDAAFPHFQLAYVFTALQRDADARTEYERVIAIDPKMAAAYLNLGILSAAILPELPGRSKARSPWTRVTPKRWIISERCILD